MKLTPNQIEWLASSFQTFLSTFLSVVGITLADGNIVWTGAFWLGVIITASRAALKAVLSKTTVPLLGGKR